MTSVGEDLAAAWDGSESETEKEVTGEAEFVDEQNTEVSGETGDGNEIDDSTGDGQEVDGDEPAEEAAIEAPQHWAKEHRELFGSQSREVQEFLLERHKAMEGDYTRGKMEIADFKKTWEPVEQLFTQYPQLNPTETIQNWANIARALDANPLQTLQYLATQYRVDLTSAENLNDGEQQEVNPEVQALRQELNGLKEDYNTRLREEQQTAVQGRVAEIDAFSKETDDNGNLLRPYVEQAMPMMISLAKVAREEGKQPSLQTLYDQAVYANPELREQVFQAEKAQEEAKRKAEAIAKAKKAKEAATSIKGGAGESDAESLSIREEITRAMG